MKYIALPKAVIVIRDKEESRKSKHGIITPDNVEQEKKSTGKIVSVGDGISYLKVGDSVMFGKFAGDTYVEGDKEYVVLWVEDREVLCRIVSK